MSRRLILILGLYAVFAGGIASAQQLAALVFFQPHSAAIDDEAYKQLSLVADDLRSHGGMIEVRGYADPEGGMPYNRALSLARAEFIAHTLRELGVPAERLRVTGRGIVSSVADDQESRRVEIRIVR